MNEETYGFKMSKDNPLVKYFTVKAENFSNLSLKIKMKKEEHKKDKYGCIDENCEEHYPVIPRKSIIAEMDSAEEYRQSMEEMNCWQNLEHIKKCEKCQKELGI